jgi:hypothetical protein
MDTLLDKSCKKRGTVMILCISVGLHKEYAYNHDHPRVLQIVAVICQGWSGECNRNRHTHSKERVIGQAR